VDRSRLSIFFGRNSHRPRHREYTDGARLRLRQSDFVKIPDIIRFGRHRSAASSLENTNPFLHQERKDRSKETIIGF
jgi:hypothetical protein